MTLGDNLSSLLREKVAQVKTRGGWGGNGSFKVLKISCRLEKFYAFLTYSSLKVSFFFSIMTSQEKFSDSTSKGCLYC